MEISGSESAYNFGRLTSIWFYADWKVKNQNSAWEQSSSNSACHSYVKKSCSPLLPQNAPCCLLEAFIQTSIQSIITTRPILFIPYYRPTDLVNVELTCRLLPCFSCCQQTHVSQFTLTTAEATVHERRHRVNCQATRSYTAALTAVKLITTSRQATWLACTGNICGTQCWFWSRDPDRAPLRAYSCVALTVLDSPKVHVKSQGKREIRPFQLQRVQK